MSFIRWNFGIKYLGFFWEVWALLWNWIFFRSVSASFLFYQIQYFCLVLARIAQNFFGWKLFSNSIRRTPADVGFVLLCSQNDTPLSFLFNAITHFAKLRTVYWYISFMLVCLTPQQCILSLFNSVINIRIVLHLASCVINLPCCIWIIKFWIEF